MSQQISDYFQDKMVEDSVFSTLLTKAITAKKRDIYRAYIKLGKEEGLIAKDLSTELILNVMDALNGMGNQLAHSDNLEIEVEQIHQIFFVWYFWKEVILSFMVFYNLSINPNQLYILIQGCKIYYIKIKRNKKWI